tara:strand:+ start:585 stop:1055 length:471 start_codon:yes stop_codon:yes gene_type:complete
MSTRANVKIVTTEGETIWLYKHHDGYPTHTGNILEFAFTLYPHNHTSEVIDYLLKQDFSLTDCEHGDINWLYIIKITKEEVDLEIFEYHFVGDVLDDGVSKAKSARFSWTAKAIEAWTMYKVYEQKSAVEEAKHRVRYYEHRLAEVTDYKVAKRVQ